MTSFILSIDQGTTSSRAVLFDKTFQPVASGQKEFTQHFPKSGWVEHDAEEIWQSVVETSRTAIKKQGATASQIAGIGITNQRETVVIWDRETSIPIHNAIVWQDRRTSEFCAELKSKGFEKEVTEKTGLLLDPYFSGTKIRWLLDNVEGARQKAEAGKLAFGTIDTYLIWRLTGGAVHKTDATNACRTLLYNIKTGEWDKSLLQMLDIPASLLPSVEDCAHHFGDTVSDLFGGSIPILGVAGDQHAATLGQGCFKPGMMKSTYGTGCFAMMNTGENLVPSKNRLLTTIGYQLDGKVTYALEGSIFIAGAAVQWLRDGIKLIDDATQSGSMAAQSDPGQDVVLVPAFAGLGAPYWEPEARGAIFGLSRGTGPNEFARATLEAVCYQTRDLIDAMKSDWGDDLQDLVLRVDGGMVASDWTMQFLADILDAKIDRPTVLETTAMGAAWLAGMKSGIWPDQDGFSKGWQLERQFAPKMTDDLRQAKYTHWKKSVAAVISMTK